MNITENLNLHRWAQDMADQKASVKNPVLIAPSFQKSGTVDSCRTVPVGSIQLLGDYTLVTNQVKAASHRMATRP